MELNLKNKSGNSIWGKVFIAIAIFFMILVTPKYFFEIKEKQEIVVGENKNDVMKQNNNSSKDEQSLKEEENKTIVYLNQKIKEEINENRNRLSGVLYLEPSNIDYDKAFERFFFRSLSLKNIYFNVFTEKVYGGFQDVDINHYELEVKGENYWLSIVQRYEYSKISIYKGSTRKFYGGDQRDSLLKSAKCYNDNIKLNIFAFDKKEYGYDFMKPIYGDILKCSIDGVNVDFDLSNWHIYDFKTVDYQGK